MAAGRSGFLLFDDLCNFNELSFPRDLFLEVVRLFFLACIGLVLVEMAHFLALAMGAMSK